MKPETQNTLTLTPMDVLQIQMVETHLRITAERNECIGVKPSLIRNTVAVWLNRIGHEGMPPRASWKALHEEWVRVFGAIL